MDDAGHVWHMCCFTRRQIGQSGFPAGIPSQHSCTSLEAATVTMTDIVIMTGSCCMCCVCVCVTLRCLACMFYALRAHATRAHTAGHSAPGPAGRPARSAIRGASAESCSEGAGGKGVALQLVLMILIRKSSNKGSQSHVPGVALHRKL